MDDFATLQAFEAAQDQLCTVTGVRPELLVADRHPGYRSSSWATTAQREPRVDHGAAPPRPPRLGDGREPTATAANR